MSKLIRHRGRWYVLLGSSRLDDRDRALKHNDTFALLDRHGDIHAGDEAAQGLYHRGTRYLSRYELHIDGSPPLLLNSAITTDNMQLAVDMTTAELCKDSATASPEGVLHISRLGHVHERVYYERLHLTNYGDDPLQVALEVIFAADYADLFEVRGVRREQRGELLDPQYSEAEALLGYTGLDGASRFTALTFTPTPSALTPELARYELELAPRGECRLEIAVACRETSRPVPIPGYDEARRRLAAEGERYPKARLFSSNEQLNDWLNRSDADLRMLRTDTPHGPYPYAGVPWFSTPFGRDGIITALQTLWYDPALARGVIGLLAECQATAIDEAREAEPGKILHETREGEMAVLGEIPFGLYYGTVDATPLFVMLVAAWYERDGDLDLLRRIWPHVLDALDWIDRYGDRDGDGFVEYLRHGDQGLLHQGWKDSDDPIFHADGEPAEGPIALCEVQGYVYAARLGAARLARALGEPDRAAALEAAAERLRERFNAVFWLPELGSYALALDGAKRPCRIRTSNAGHALYTGIADRDKAERLAETLLHEDSFSGWGVRTLAASEPRYNPMAYHNGSIWPHDNSLIADGLARYGHRDAALRVLEGLFNASIRMDLSRLPELFCGFTARPSQGPIAYPAACSPQAWAAGSAFLLLQATLGLSFSREAPQITFHPPRLPEYLDWLEIRGLRVGAGEVDLVVLRHDADVGVRVARKVGDIEVAIVT